MNHERDRREYNRKLAIEMNKSGGAVFGRNEIPGEYSILNGSMVFRKKGSNDPWIEWKGTYDHLAPGRTPHGKLPADQYSVGTSNKVTLGGKTYDLSIPAHLKLYQEAGEIQLHSVIVNPLHLLQKILQDTSPMRQQIHLNGLNSGQKVRYSVTQQE